MENPDVQPALRRLRPLQAFAALLALGVLLTASAALRSGANDGAAPPPEPVRGEPAVAPGDPATDVAAVPASVPDSWYEAESPPPSRAPEEGGHECLLQPSDVVSVGSPIPGRIERIAVERSDLVGAGQLVVELESSVPQAVVDLAEARSEMIGALDSRSANADFERRRQERAKALFARDALADETRDEVETRARVAELELLRAREEQRLASLELKRARADLDLRSIRTPIPGVVTERLMSAGEVAFEEQTILRIARIDPLWVEAVLPASLFGTVKVGSRAAVTPELGSGDVHVAEVIMVDRVVDAASGTFSVRMALPNPDHGIPSGLHCRVRFLDD